MTLVRAVRHEAFLIQHRLSSAWGRFLKESFGCPCEQDEHARALAGEQIHRVLPLGVIEIQKILSEFCQAL